jgi:hypothetical protein
MALPDFLIVGAPKAGSTALHVALAKHPQLHLSGVKEPKFFLCDEAPPAPQHGPGDAHSAREWIWRRDEYEALFAGAPAGTLRGESTPLYLADFAAHERMARLVPSARLVVIVRDPVDRAYSNWTHLWSDGLEPVADFVEACSLEEERVRRGWAPFWRYLGLGRYGEQLQHLRTSFDPAAIHVLRYRELVERPDDALDGICRFLGVDEGLVSVVPSENVSTFVDDTPLNTVVRAGIRGCASLGAHLPPQVWRTASKPLLKALKRQHANRPELSPAQRSELAGNFVDDVALLERLTGESFDDWLGWRETGTFSVRKASVASA